MELFMHVFERDEASTRWISIAFLQGEDAEEFLELIDEEGPISAIYRLSERDLGDESVEAALANGYVYDTVPAGSTDHTIEPFGSPYALTYSEKYGYVSLLRRYEAQPQPEPAPGGGALLAFERPTRSIAGESRAPTSSAARGSRMGHGVAL
ncbi:hypothetical protein MUN74_18255 [Agromyces endophyticus]|uniref:hypothetical protein n=1 Tax=Agromyces sp. H17E-10 TaxID=2932244 RepID=UPI001FD0C821|nr:hypothetical protein [Agromyces sp. H17E-10]UOQ89176.1 hypothetical protein MUN74_18255 [Agromyces sp. H17E-10]